MSGILMGLVVRKSQKYFVGQQLSLIHIYLTHCSGLGRREFANGIV